MKKKNKNAVVAQVSSACTSLVCMAQMGTMTVVGATSMGAMSVATTGSVPFITLVFQSIGLGFLLVFPAIYYQILMIIILGLTIFVSYLSYKFHKNTGLFGLIVISSILLYTSIYLFISEILYWIAFILMVISVVWSYGSRKKMK